MIRKILVSQPQPTSPKSPYAELAEKYGVEFTFRPFIKVVGISAAEFRRQRVDILKHTAIVFTSRHAIDHFFAMCKALRLNMPETMKYFATTESVALYIQKYVQYRKRKVFFGTTGKVDDLVPVMAKHKNEKYLVPQNDGTEGGFSKKLDEKGLKHTDCVMYRTVSVPITKEEVFSHGMVVLFTAAGVGTLVNSFPEFEQGMLRLATLGNAARTAAEEHNLRVDVVAPLPKQPSITGAIAQYLEEEAERDRAADKTSEEQDAVQQEEKLRRSVAAKKGAETKRRKQMLTDHIAQLEEEKAVAEQKADECRQTVNANKQVSDQLKREMEAAQKAFTAARQETDRSQREAEKARRAVRDIQAHIDAAKEELEEIDAAANRKKAKPATEEVKETAKKEVSKKEAEKKETGVKATVAKPKTAASTIKKAATKTTAKTTTKATTTTAKTATKSAAKATVAKKTSTKTCKKTPAKTTSKTK